MRRFLLFALTLALQSCAIRSVYLPVSQNVALFDSSTELQASAFLSFNHVELQAAVSPGKHFAVASNIDFGRGITVYDAALGWHGHDASARWRTECWAGFGYNENSLYPGSNDVSVFNRNGGDYRVRALYQRYYVQPAVGLCGVMPAYSLQYFFALSARASLLHFNDFTFRQIDPAQTTDPASPVYLTDRHYSNKMLYLLEPCLTNKVTRGRVTGILQLQAIIPYSESIDIRNTRFSPGLLFSGGIGYHLSLKAKKITWE